MIPPRAAFIRRLAGSGPFGLGASSLGNLYRPIDDAQGRATVDAAWDQGVRYFDTAPFYGFGLSERRLGDALRDRPRDDLVLSTKVGRLLVPGTASGDRFGFHSPMPFDPVFDYSYDGVMRSVEASLHRLGLARIDLLLMHDLGRLTHGADHDRTFAQAVDGGFRAMTELRDGGVVAAIGLGVNEVAVCEAALERADLDVLMIAGRYTLLEQGAAPFLARCHAQGIGVVAAAVFNSGILATGAGRADAPYDYGPAPAAVIRRVTAIEAQCERFGVPLPAAALRFVAAHPAVTKVVIGAASPGEIGQAAEFVRTTVPDALWRALRDDGLMDENCPMPKV